MTYSTIDTATAKISKLKEFAKTHGFSPLGNKNFKAVWVAAVDFYIESKKVAEQIKTEVVQTFQESQVASEVVAIEVENIVIEVAKILTSDTAINIYKTTLRGILLLIVLVCFTIGKVTLLAWNNRDKTAVYHWIKQLKDSKVGYRIRCEILVYMLSVTVKIDDIKVMVESVLCRSGLAVSPLLTDLEMM